MANRIKNKHNNISLLPFFFSNVFSSDVSPSNVSSSDVFSPNVFSSSVFSLAIPLSSASSFGISFLNISFSNGGNATDLENNFSDDEYNDPKAFAALAELFGAITNNSILSAELVQPVILISQTQQSIRIKRRTPTTLLLEVLVTIKVTNYTVVFGNRTPKTFKPTADPTHPTQQNYFGKMDV